MHLILAGRRAEVVGQRTKNKKNYLESKLI